MFIIEIVLGIILILLALGILLISAGIKALKLVATRFVTIFVANLPTFLSTAFGFLLGQLFK